MTQTIGYIALMARHYDGAFAFYTGAFGFAHCRAERSPTGGGRVARAVPPDAGTTESKFASRLRLLRHAPPLLFRDKGVAILQLTTIAALAKPALR